MKVILVLLVVFTAQTFAQNILECFAVRNKGILALEIN